MTRVTLLLLAVLSVLAMQREGQLSATVDLPSLRWRHEQQQAGEAFPVWIVVVARPLAAEVEMAVFQIPVIKGDVQVAADFVAGPLVVGLRESHDLGDARAVSRLVWNGAANAS